MTKTDKMATAKTGVRNSSFEILRIIAILCIVASHFSVHGHFAWDGAQDNLLAVNQTYILWLKQLGGFGVNLFVLISAFFLSGKTVFKTKKLLTIALDALFFSLAIGIAQIIVEKPSITPPTIFSIIFPIGNGTWWFITTYFVLYLLSPFFNRALSLTNKTAHLILVGVFFAMWVIMPTIFSMNYAMADLPWFCFLYLLAAYFRKYDVKLHLRPVFGILIAVIMLTGWFAIGRLLEVRVGQPFTSSVLDRWFRMYLINNFVQVSAATILFLSFKEIKIRSVK